MIESFIVGFIGFFAGYMFLTALLRWVAVVWETARLPRPDGPRNFSFAMAAAVSAFHSGPWMIVAAAVLVYFVHAEAWFRPVIVGAGRAAVAFASVVVRLLRHLNTKDAG
jgi:hypothetical protein